MRMLLVNNHCITDPTCGVTQSLRTLMEWLAEAGHACHILTTARFETAVPFTIQEHLRQRGAIGIWSSFAHDLTGRVPITVLMTTHHDEHQPCRRETEQYLRQADVLLREFRPDVVMACNGHPMIRTVLAKAKAQGVTTVFALRGYGYESHHFNSVDHVLTCSRFLSEHYRAKIGLESTPLAPPISWADVVVPDEARRCVTFVHPAFHKGLMVFLRLADMLHRRRPDIPLLVVESNQAMAGFGLDRVLGVHRMDPVAKPADWLRYTKVLLVPSVWEEPFGRVAAEAMINGIPPIVSDRGGLPDVVGQVGQALSLPEWLTPDRLQLPTESDVHAWYDAILSVWDDPAQYAWSSDRCRVHADTHYSEAVSRQAHLAFVEQAVTHPAVT
jgi:glycosyltransferase involved in cell wall biosynthesis